MRGAARTGKRDGFVLVSVLWLGAFLIVLVAALLQQSRTTLAVARSGVEETIADAMLTGAVETLGLAYAKNAVPSTADGRLQQIAIDGGNVAVAVQDANGLIDPNRAAESVIRQFASTTGASRLAPAILDRRGDPGQPSATAFRVREEIADLPAADNTVVAFLDNYGTLFSSSGAINPMTAPAAVLAMLPGVDAATAAAVVALREQPKADPQKVMGLLQAASAVLDPTLGRAFDVFLAARVGNGLTKTLRVTMVFDGDATVPYRIVDWRPWAQQPTWVRPGATLKG